MNKEGSRVAAWLSLIAIAVALYMVFLYAPPEKTMGDIQRIFYFHVASAWNAFLAFFVVFVASIVYLKTRSSFWDALAYSSSEIGVVFTTIVLVTGPIWGKAVWGVWWDWEPRLTTTLILWFIYIAYLVIRGATEGELRQRYSAVFGIIGFIDVPIVFFSIHWWRTLHPVVIRAGQVDLAPSMLTTLIVSVISFTVLYWYLLGERLSLELVARDIKDMKDSVK